MAGLSFTPTGNLLAGGGDNQVLGVIKLFNGTNWAELIVFKRPTIVQGVAVSNDGTFLLTTEDRPITGGNAQVAVWSTQTLSLNGTLPITGTVNALYEIIISDNTFYVAAAGNSKAYSWQRSSTAAPFTENPAIDSGIDNIALSPKGGMLLVIPVGNNQIA